MISKSSFLGNWKTLPLLLIVFTVFTVSLSDSLQVADGFKADGNKKVFQLNPGETDMIPWAITNNKNVTLTVVLYATGEGSDLLLFEENHTIEPGIRKEVPIYVTIPDDHPTDIEYRPELYVQRPAPELEEGVTGIAVALQYRVIPSIQIGDNPIYTPPVTEEPERKIIKEKDVVEKAPVVEVPEETLEEKLQRIRDANQASAPAQVKVDDTFEESFEEEAVPELQVDDNYIAEPIADPEPVQVQEEPKECDFFAWLLSLFGIGTCK